jgi:HAD superfamily hydrolase (TIGR01490 family)
MEYNSFKDLGRLYAEKRLPIILKEEAIKKLMWHKKEGHRLVVVSASIKEWLKPWCQANEIELICTEMEIQDAKLTGKISGRNCNGREKANRIKSIIDLSKYDHIYAYGNSAGDKAMLALADEKFLNKFW